MNRGALREELKAVLQEPAGEEYDLWSKPQLNAYLNMGLAEMEAAILEVDSAAFVAEDSFGVTEGIQLYAVPLGCMSILRVTGATARLRRRDEGEIQRENLGGTRADTFSKYGILGRYIRICPIPATSVANALTITYVPTLTMAADEDTPGIHPNLERGIVMAAAQIALQGTGDKDMLGTVMIQKSEILKTIPKYYRPAQDGVRWIRPDYDEIDGDDPAGFDFSVRGDQLVSR